MTTDGAFESLYRSATYITCDGWPIVWLARRAGRRVQRTTGADLVVPVCTLAAERAVGVFLFGTSADALSLSRDHLIKTAPGLTIAGTAAPPYGFNPTSRDAAAFAHEIAASGAAICLVALGAPKQEIFAAFCKTICPHVGFLCVGAGLDYVAGTQRRAPAIVRALGLEWAWRWSRSPRRLTRRYIRCVATFGALVRSAFRYDSFARRAGMRGFKPF